MRKQPEVIVYLVGGTVIYGLDYVYYKNEAMYEIYPLSGEYVYRVAAEQISYMKEKPKSK